jgi:hypothetical protein
MPLAEFPRWFAGPIQCHWHINITGPIQ